MICPRCHAGDAEYLGYCSGCLRDLRAAEYADHDRREAQRDARIARLRQAASIRARAIAARQARQRASRWYGTAAAGPALALADLVLAWLYSPDRRERVRVAGLLGHVAKEAGRIRTAKEAAA